ncbi:unnamed protein product [Pipistrellus nathusii]|uniref:Uncharacterized protein n=1 Tax=Pipistrellus nathusii TaxID=59473 RepID=A0ABN9ZMJ5_PIPNA
MEPFRSLALLVDTLALIFALVALSTDYWFVAIGPGFLIHAGIWPEVDHEFVQGFIRVTEAFSILAALSGLVSVVLLGLSYVPSLSSRNHGPRVAAVLASIAALFMLVAMSVYNGFQWGHRHPQIQFFFSWSFYLGWVSFPLWIIAGIMGHLAYTRNPRAGYDQV